jgi:hypothetical protein
MNRIAASVLVLAVVAFALPALAQPKVRRNVYTLKPVEIMGRVRTPIASIEVSKASPAVAPTELRQAFVERIEQTVRSSSL